LEPSQKSLHRARVRNISAPREAMAGPSSCLRELMHWHWNSQEPHLKVWQRNANLFCWTVWKAWKIWQFSRKLCFKIAKYDVTYLGPPIRICIQKRYFYHNEPKVWRQLCDRASAPPVALLTAIGEGHETLQPSLLSSDPSVQSATIPGQKH